MEGWRKISDFPADEKPKLRWMLRNAEENGIVKSGVAIKFGRPWYINVQRLTVYLQEQTLQALGKEAA